MENQQANESIQYLAAKNIPFLTFGEELGGALPLRRILSLVRMKEVETVVFETHIPTDPLCNGCASLFLSEEKSFKRPCRSCHAYIKSMQEGSYSDKKLQKKVCHRLHFLNKSPRDVEEGRFATKDIVGYCIVHIDTFQQESKVMTFSYVPECVLDMDSELHPYGEFSAETKIGESLFSVSGNYYSQQNGLTNCCSHAAIKMALRGFIPGITSEVINKTYLPSVSQPTRTGADGMTTKEIREAIEAVSGGRLDTFSLIANGPCGYEFTKNIYHAIESKIPVILIITTPSCRDVSDKYQSHAIAVVGHTFHPHGWSAYGGIYFFEGQGGYLSSFHWCDNFVVQDDNFGPLYQIPPRLLIDIINDSNREKSFKYSAMARHQLNENGHDIRVSAICVYPKKMQWVCSITSVEHVASYLLHRHVHLLAANEFLPKNKEFLTYFYKVFIIDGQQQRFQPESFVFRTVLARKSEYLTDEIRDIYAESEILEMVESALPEYFWVVEISISELFWVNKAKVGEVIIDPDLLYANLQSKSVLDFTICPLIRIPYSVTINGEICDALSETVERLTVDLVQKKPHQKLITTRKSVLRDA